MHDFIYTIGVVALIFAAMAILNSFIEGTQKNTARLEAEKYKMKVFIAERAKREAESEAAREWDENPPAGRPFRKYEDEARIEKITAAGEMAFNEVMKKNLDILGHEVKS